MEVLGSRYYIYNACWDHIPLYWALGRAIRRRKNRLRRLCKALLLFSCAGVRSGPYPIGAPFPSRASKALWDQDGSIWTEGACSLTAVGGGSVELRRAASRVSEMRLEPRLPRSSLRNAYRHPISHSARLQAGILIQGTFCRNVRICQHRLLQAKSTRMMLIF